MIDWGENEAKRMFEEKAEEIEETVDVATEEPEVETEEVEEVETEEVEAEAAEDGEDETEAEEEYVVLTVDGEAPPQEEEAESAPEWVRELRKQYREEKRRNKELEQQLKAVQPKEELVQLGPKPVIEDFDYDSEKFHDATEAWYEQKRKHEEAKEAERKKREAVDAEWQQKLEGYQQAKTSLKVRDFEDAEDVVKDTLSVTQQGMILQGSDNPAALIYVLGKDANRAKELASITDPVKFAFAVARLETKVKTETRKAAIKPEKTLTGTGRTSGAVDNTLEQLRAEAARTGDYSKVHAYRKKKRSA